MTARSRTFGQLVEAIPATEPVEAQETPKRDPVRLLLIAVLFLALVVGFFLVRWRVIQTAKLPNKYLAYTEDADPYKDNESVKEARRLYRENNREDACTDFVIIERSYGWAIYCEGEKPSWLTEQDESQ